MIMSKKDKIIIGISLVIVILCFVYLFQASYAKYRKKINGNIKATVAGWNIKVNTETISGKKELTNDIVPVFLGDDNTKAGVIAPGATGYFDLTIDASLSDVSFTYKINTTVASDSAVIDLVATSYIVNPSATNTTTTAYDDATGITGTIAHNTASTVIRVYIKWDDSATNQMSNAVDTDVAIDENSKALMKTTIVFTQINS